MGLSKREYYDRIFENILNQDIVYKPQDVLDELDMVNSMDDLYCVIVKGFIIISDGCDDQYFINSMEEYYPFMRMAELVDQNKINVYNFFFEEFYNNCKEFYYNKIRNERIDDILR